MDDHWPLSSWKSSVIIAGENIALDAQLIEVVTNMAVIELTVAAPCGRVKLCNGDYS